jgi:hypothetical protein
MVMIWATESPINRAALPIIRAAFWIHLTTKTEFLSNWEVDQIERTLFTLDWL